MRRHRRFRNYLTTIEPVSRRNSKQSETQITRDARYGTKAEPKSDTHGDRWYPSYVTDVTGRVRRMLQIIIGGRLVGRAGSGNNHIIRGVICGRRVHQI